MHITKSSDKKIVSVAVARPLDQLFSYGVPDEFADAAKPGVWVKIPFGRSITHGFILNELKDQNAPDQLKDIIEVGPPQNELPEEVLKLCDWASRYYEYPIGEALNSAAPAAALGLKTKKSTPRQFPVDRFEPTLHVLNEEQEKSFQYLDELKSRSLTKNEKRVALLEGVTGSGKTEIYIQLALDTIKEGKGVIILVPEISLTPQLHERIQKGIGMTVGLWHSALSAGKRRDIWSAMQSGELKVIVGARSAIFCPIKNLGLIVIDEEHDSSYKQEERFRYHARDLAIVRASYTDSLVVLGSATPSLETLKNVDDKKFFHTKLTKRIVGANLPEIDLVDLKNEEITEGLQARFATRVIDKIRETILNGDQVMVFLNRRGFASYLLCEECGVIQECVNCSISLTYHKFQRNLKCHMCGYSEVAPLECPTCHSKKLVPMGAGTESLETELPQLIPELKPIRLDRDKITSVARVEQVIQDFKDKKFNILLGTQMLVKGHDFPGVTLVVVVCADNLFRWPDFRANEKAVQTLTQVSGRAGRSDKGGKVLIQTYSPDHPVLSVIDGRMSFEDFLKEEKDLRAELHYPPYGRLARMRIESNFHQDSKKRATLLADAMNRYKDEKKMDLEILGPSEALIEKVKNTYRQDILLKSQNVSDLHQILRISKAICHEKGWPCLVDVDPVSVG